MTELGRYDDARPWFERAVEAKEQGDVHGRVDHGSVVTSVLALVQALLALGRDDEARAWQERVHGLE